MCPGAGKRIPGRPSSRAAEYSRSDGQRRRQPSHEIHVEMIGVEAGGRGVDTDEHCASLSKGTPGVLHGNRTYLLQDLDGQIQEGHSISAGLDYPGVGPEHAWLKEQGRVSYRSATDREALDAFQYLATEEGIIPALEPSHALAELIKIAPEMQAEAIVILNLCGRGDKDILTVSSLIDGDNRRSGKGQWGDQSPVIFQG